MPGRKRRNLERKMNMSRIELLSVLDYYQGSAFLENMSVNELTDYLKEMRIQFLMDGPSGLNESFLVDTNYN